MFKENDIALKITNQPTKAEGVYNFSERQIKYGEYGQHLQNVMVSVHESLHEYLNKRTLYGLLIEYYVQLYTKTNSKQFLNIINTLVKSCRTVHEVYATYISTLTVYDLIQKGNFDYLKKEGLQHDLSTKDLLSDYPKYLNYYQTGADLVASFESIDAKNAVLNGILISCMQSKALGDLILEKGFHHLDRKHIQQLVSPDAQLKILQKALKKIDWKEVLATVDISFDKASHITHEAKNYNQFIHQIYKYCTHILAQQGIATIAFEAHLVIEQQLIQMAYEYLGEIKDEIKVAIPKAGIHPIRKMFLNERLFFNAKKRSASAIILKEAAFQQLLKIKKTSATRVNIFIIYRTGIQLTTQYTFVKEIEEVLHSHFKQPKFFIQQLEEENLAFFAIKKAQILELAKMDSYQLILNFSFLEYLDKQTQLKPFFEDKSLTNVLLTFLLDISPFTFLQLIQEKNIPFTHLYCKEIALETNELIYYGIAFFETQTQQLLLSPCSNLASIGFVNYLDTLEESPIVYDKNAFPANLEKAAHQLLDRMICIDYTFKFHL